MGKVLDEALAGVRSRLHNKALRQHEKHERRRAENLFSEKARIEASGVRCRLIAADRYFVTETGEVYGASGERAYKLKPGTKPGGYNFVGLANKGLRYTMVHRLVAEAFIPNTYESPEVNHKDGNKKNNHFMNLEWVTRKENASHAVANGLTANGDRMISAKLSSAKAIAIRNDGRQYSLIAADYGVCKQTVCNIKKGRIWKRAEAVL